MGNCPWTPKPMTISSVSVFSNITLSPLPLPIPIATAASPPGAAGRGGGPTYNGSVVASSHYGLKDYAVFLRWAASPAPGASAAGALLTAQNPYLRCVWDAGGGIDRHSPGRPPSLFIIHPTNSLPARVRQAALLSLVGRRRAHLQVAGSPLAGNKGQSSARVIFDNPRFIFTCAACQTCLPSGIFMGSRNYT